MLSLDTYCTHIPIAERTRLDLFTPSMFRIRTSQIEGDPFPLQYEIPFAIGHLKNWAHVEHSVLVEGDTIHITTDTLRISCQSDGSFKVFDPTGEHQICPSDGPQFGLFKDGYTHFDSASAFNEPNENSRYCHWFYNPETDTYHDTFVEEDLLKDEFFIYGPDYPSLFNAFNRLTGYAPKPPRKAFGLMQTQHLAVAGTQAILMEDARTMREKNIPCDTWIIDFEWGDGVQDGKQICWGADTKWASGYSAPLSPNEMMAQLKAMHFDTMIIHHSVPDFPSRWNQGWTGHPTDPQAWWAEMESKLEGGLAGTWQDTRRNDISNDVIQRGLRQRMNGKRPLMITNFDTQDVICWNRQNYHIPQANGIGTHRYPIHWTGDCDFTWQELRWQIEAITGPHGALKAVPYLNSDTIGRNWKLLIRWRQFNAFCPIARSHNTKPWAGGNPSNEEWLDGFEEGFAWEKKEPSPEQKAYSDKAHAECPVDWSGDPESAIREIQKLRYRLMPYLYSLAHENYMSGLPLCRPLLMSFPEDSNCNANQHPLEYMLGDSLLVAPVCYDTATIKIYLPAGANWIDFHTSTRYEGGQTIDYDVSDLALLPLFVKEGSILPMQEACEWLEPGAPDPLILQIYGTEARAHLWEDDGTTEAYLNGEAAHTCFEARDGTLIIEPTIGTYNGMPETRNIEAQLCYPEQRILGQAEYRPARGGSFQL